MKRTADTSAQSRPFVPVQPDELTAFSALDPLNEKLRVLEGELLDYAQSADAAVGLKARKLVRKIREFEPSVTFIGQVKAGKTTLVNAVAGWPDLLPADVNPWTSVVTSLHLSARHQRSSHRSAFRFFSQQEWGNLLQQGGRIGEIACRAGAAEEMAKVRQQLDEMREKSRKRLGKRFDLLLGQTHDYEKLDADLIKRYVCMGDDFWDGSDFSRERGQFADITKTADLWFSGPNLPIGLCIQDTPGVNDTFMIREQITLNGLRASRLCVVVLSAQQALSSVDLGLIRLISNVKARDIVIFVNRIDELSDPARDVPNIRISIAETLKKYDGPQDAEVIFGSAHWAHHAVSNTLDQIGAASADALMSWAEAEVTTADAAAAPRDIIWQLSGAPSLGNAIAQRIAAGAGDELIQKITSEMQNLQTGAAAFDRARHALEANAGHLALLQGDMAAQIDAIKQQTLANLQNELERACTTFDHRAENARRTFLERATADLVKHLDHYGENEVWSYDPVGLRMLLRSTYQVFGRSASKAATTQMAQAAGAVSDVLTHALGQNESPIQIVPTPVPTADAPVGLAQTIALDLKGSWWSRFWRSRRGYQAFAEDFANLIYEETASIPQTLRSDYVDAYCAVLQRALTEFMDDQREMILGIANSEPPSTSPSVKAIPPKQAYGAGR